MVELDGSNGGMDSEDEAALGAEGDDEDIGEEEEMQAPQSAGAGR